MRLCRYLGVVYANGHVAVWVLYATLRIIPRWTVRHCLAACFLSVLHLHRWVYVPVHEEAAMDRRQQNVVLVDGRLSQEPDIARWLWAFQDARQRTMEQLVGLTQAVIDWVPPDQASSIGTVLYHLALIDTDWLYAEILEQVYPPEIVTLFPYDDRDGHGHLTQVDGITLDQHLDRLATVRQRLLQVFHPMSLHEFRRIRQLPAYDVTPEWVLHHLLQHEAEHRSQLGALRATAEHALHAA